MPFTRAALHWLLVKVASEHSDVGVLSHLDTNLFWFNIPKLPGLFTQWAIITAGTCIMHCVHTVLAYHHYAHAGVLLCAIGCSSNPINSTFCKAEKLVNNRQLSVVELYVCWILILYLSMNLYSTKTILFIIHINGFDSQFSYL